MSLFKLIPVPVYAAAMCVIFFSCLYKLYQIHKTKQQRDFILFFSCFAFESVATAAGRICWAYYPAIADSPAFLWGSIANGALLFAALIATVIIRNKHGQIPAEDMTRLKKQMKWLLVAVLLFATAILGLYFILSAALREN